MFGSHEQYARSDEPSFAGVDKEAIGWKSGLLFEDNRVTTAGQFMAGGTNLPVYSVVKRFVHVATRSFSLRNVTWIRDKNTFRCGGEFKRHQYDSAPEEQATEFEKFTHPRSDGQRTEATLSLAHRELPLPRYSAYIAENGGFQTLNKSRTRDELSGGPLRKQGRIGNFDFSSFESCFTQNGSLSVCDAPSSGFLVPANVQNTGLGNVDAAVAATTRAGNNHTLNGQDTNNFAPRIGFAYSPLSTNRMVIRGGYGVFYDRPSAAFINTIFSNYPFLREIEITVPSGNVPITTAFSQQLPDLALSSWLPFRVMRTAGAGGTYVIRGNTGITRDPRLNVTPAGNIAETFEFRAIDRDLKTPFVHQLNLGVQYELTKNLMFEARYVHTRGQNLLQALAFNQGFDLNDPSTPDHIFERFNQAYAAAGAPNGPLNAGSTARERGLGKAFGLQIRSALGFLPLASVEWLAVLLVHQSI